MNRLLSLALATSLALMPATVGSADPKPKGAKNAPAQVVANALAGKTSLWKSCKGGIYFGPNWQATAWCSKKGDAVGLGTWKVNSKGRVCHDLTWYWQDGNKVGSEHKPVTKENCDDHVIAPDGAIWRSWGGEKDWWKLTGSKSFVKGFKFKRKTSRLRKKLGV